MSINFFWTSSEKHRQGFQNCIINFQTNILRKNFFLLWIKLCIFQPVNIKQKIFENLVGNFKQRCQNCILRVQWNSLRNFSFWKKKFFWSFLDFEKKCFVFYAKIFWQGCQNCNLRVRRILLLFKKAWTCPVRIVNSQRKKSTY